MPDTIGRISVPATTATAVFPLRTNYGHGRARKRLVIPHTFGSSDAKTEQRFYVGPAATRHLFTRPRLGAADVTALKAFWEARQGAFGSFLYDVPNDDSATFTRKTVCFDNQPLTLEELTNAAAVGLTFIEIPDPAAAPSYGITATVERFPDSTLGTALTAQVQDIVPLVRIRVIEAAVDDIFVSDRRVTVGGNLYLPRLLQVGDPSSDVLISQSIDGAADNVQFSLGNADRVMVQCANDTELKKARIELSLFHVGSGYKLDLWAGEIVDWKSDDGPEFVVYASDIISALTLQSPIRNVSRVCWRIYADANFGCPIVKAVDTRDLVHFPSSDMASCDLGYDTPNGCLAHVAAIRSFGGALVTPQQVRIADNSTGTIGGFGRDLVTPTSQIDDSVWGATLPEIWHNDDGVPQKGLPVQCRIAAGRDESDFYAALGIVGRGPIGAFTTARMVDTDGDGKKETFIGSTLDGQPHHGFRQTDDSGNYADSGFGLRPVLGTDPAGAGEYFSLGRLGTTPTSWREVVSGPSVYLNNFAAGTAFLDMRRTDQPGIQPSTVQSHQMTAMISQGLTALTWAGPGSRGTLAGCTNPFWVAINTFLRSLGVDGLAAGVQEQYFDVTNAVAAANNADLSVPALFGGGSEAQFRFKGTLDTLKALRDQLRDILNNGLGYYTWSFGKLKLGCRINAIPETLFAAGNMLFRSLNLEPLKPGFEKLTISFADEDYLFAKNTVDYTDQDYALRNGRVQNPRASQFGLIGAATKSGVARIATVRTREELGGVGLAEQTNARIATWKSTILALDTEAGRVTGITSPDIPTGFGIFRIVRWNLHRDYSVTLTGRSVTAAIYDLTVGTIPADVGDPGQTNPPPRDSDVPPAPLFSGRIAPDDPTSAEVYNLHFATDINTLSITSGTFTFYYFDASVTMPTLSAGITNSVLSMTVSSATGISSGTYLKIGSEWVLAGTPSGTTIPITRAQLGSTAAAHSGGDTVTIQSARVVGASFPTGFFSNPALVAAWTLRTSLPGMTVDAISGFVTNPFGDSPTTTIFLTLVLKKNLIDPGGHKVDGDVAIWMSDQVIDSGVPLVDLATKKGVQQEAYLYAADTGSANAYAIAQTPAPVLVAGSIAVLKVAHTNTGASTFSLNSGSTTAIKKESASGLVDLDANDWQAGQISVIVFDGSVWQWISGSGGSGSSGVGVAFADNEIPSGSVNNSNVSFTLAHSPSPASCLVLYVNGVLQIQGTDYTVSGGTVTFVNAPSTGAILTAFYRYVTASVSTDFADNEVPGGSVNNSNVTFTLAHSPNPSASLALYVNGVFQIQGTDYTLSGGTAIFTDAPSTGALLLAFYRF